MLHMLRDDLAQHHLLGEILRADHDGLLFRPASGQNERC